MHLYKHTIHLKLSMNNIHFFVKSNVKCISKAKINYIYFVVANYSIIFFNIKENNIIFVFTNYNKYVQMYFINLYGYNRLLLS